MFPRAWRDAPMTFNHVMQLVRTLVVVLTMRFGYTSVHMQAARCTNDQRHWSTWGEYMLDPVTVGGQNAAFRLPTSHTGFLVGIRPVDLHSESLGYELQDVPMISAIRTRGGSICPIQYCLRVKTPHFDGLVRTPLTGPGISITTIMSRKPFLYSL